MCSICVENGCDVIVLGDDDWGCVVCVFMTVCYSVFMFMYAHASTQHGVHGMVSCATQAHATVMTAHHPPSKKTTLMNARCSAFNKI